jgi:cation diffusion facilitator CzcD-associated flavoprotein CzcO
MEVQSESQYDGAKCRCAIIGSGLSGLATGYLLQCDERYNNVTVFEQVWTGTRILREPSLTMTFFLQLSGRPSFFRFSFCHDQKRYYERCRTN